MATLVCFHAHPDDEAIATAGTMAKAVADGHRVVLVCATRGECGEVADGFLRDGETLGERRTEEVIAAARILGLHRGEFLGYRDSGMVGTETNDDPTCFHRADLEEAAERLATILREEDADVLTVYDERGGYGHPDHIKVHQVGIRAAELAGTPRVFESTIDQDAIRALVKAGQAAAAADPALAADFPDDMPDVDEMQLGMPGHLITTRIDVSAHLEQKRAAMAAHASQISETSFFLKLPADFFARSFGTEWYIQRDVDKAEAVVDDLFAGLG